MTIVGRWGEWSRSHKIVWPLVVATLTTLVAVVRASSEFTEFKFGVEPSDVIAVKGKKALLNCSAIHGSDVPTMQWLRDGVLMNLAGDTRRHLLANGSLLFDEVIHQRAHRPDEGVFQCVASVTQLGTIVSRKAKLKVANLARTFNAEPQSLKVHLGDNAMFACDIDGAPSPKITWYRDDVLIRETGNINYKFYQDGMLEISNVQFPDLGTYKCKAESVDRTSQESGTGSLTQNSDSSTYAGVAPAFIMTPKNKVALEGSTVVFHCGANGRDRRSKLPTITWLKEGTTIDLENLDSRFRKEGQGSLVIMSVQEKDAGVYTCRATNMEESADADAHLTVHMPPYFRKRPRSTRARQNEDILFECDVYGIPKPTIQWRKNGDLVIPSDYFQIVDGRNLRILGLVSSDQGLYQCFGENSVGSIQAGAQLKIVNPNSTSPSTGSAAPGSAGELPSAPTNLQAAIVSTRFVTVTWNAPTKPGIPPADTYSIYWKEEGVNRERVMNTSREEANIQHLKPNTIYEIRVVAYNSKGAGKTAAQTTIQTQSEVNVPNKPRNLLLQVVSATSIKLTWEAPEKRNTAMPDVTYYKVHYYPQGATKEENVNVAAHEKVLEGLHPFTQYNIRVVAYNSEGAGLSTDEVSTRTYSAIPSGPPQNFSLETASSSSILVRWQPPVEEKQNGIINGYKIRYKKAGDKRGDSVTTDANIKVYALNNLERGTEYSVRIAALNVNGSSPNTPWVTARTMRHDLDEAQVPGKPTSLSIRPMDTSISVSWTPPREQYIMIRGYMLGYGKGIPDVYTQALDAKLRFYTIRDLEPSAGYVISLSAYNNVGQGEPIYENVRTREATTPEPSTPIVPPVGLKARVLSSSTIVLTWTDTTLGRSQEITDSRYYTVRYLNRASNQRPKYVNSTDLNVHIDNLKPDSIYEFSVKVTKGRRRSTWSLVTTNRTFEAAPETAPRSVTPVAVPNRPTSVVIQWQPPRAPNGEITGYIIYYTEDPEQDESLWAVKPVMGDTLVQRINGLQYQTTYYFKVQARNSKGYGPYSKVKAFQTPRPDGTGGGIIDTVVGVHGGRKNTKYNFPTSGGDQGAGKEDKEEAPTNHMLWIIIASLAALTLIAVAVITAILCKRRTETKAGRNKKGYKPANKAGPKDLKPPDLWIHHEQMELKNIDKRDQSDSNMSTSPVHRSTHDIKSEDGSTTYSDKRRNSFINEHHSFDHRDDDRYKRPIRGKPIMIPVDANPPPPSYNTATVQGMPNGSYGPETTTPLVRPVYPRTQYTMPYAAGTPRVNAADLSQLTSSVKPMPQQPQSPLPKSGPPSSTTTPVKPRSGLPTISPKAPDVIRSSEESPLHKSGSTEELSAEMANLEGLMKDLNAITQQEFEC